MTAAQYTLRPLGPWLEKVTTNRKGNPFRAKWSDTLELLGSELNQLGAKNIVLQIDVQEGDLRLDGMLRANAKVGFPGVRISFESKYGPLTYATDEFVGRYYSDPPDWQINVRAIALALQALRAVDRYGVTKRGEQYTGWKALPAGQGAAASHMTDSQARIILQRWAAKHPKSTMFDSLATQARLARAMAHPDRHEGDHTYSDELLAALAVLGLDR
jgi:hypothetical protein